MHQGKRSSDSPIIDVVEEEDFEHNSPGSPLPCLLSPKRFYSRLAALSALQSSYNYYLNSPLVAQTAALSRALIQNSSSITPSETPGKSSSSTCSSQAASPEKKTKLSRKKTSRKLTFDEDKSSPVSGTIIRQRAEGEEVPAIHKGMYKRSHQSSSDIDPEFNVVEVTDEAKAELAKIENKIGDFICRLCKEDTCYHNDNEGGVTGVAAASGSPMCNMIVHVEYRCPECEKVFNCPANLASHRRWHKPKANGEDTFGSSEGSIEYVSEQPERFTCKICHKKFKRRHSLKKHFGLHVVNNSDVSEPKYPPKYSIADLLTNNKSELSFPCRVCSLSFSTFSELTSHSAKAHYSLLLNSPSLLVLASANLPTQNPL
ncbi:Nervous fingers 2 CG12809PAlike, partial [Caligus rogercresseyi]